MDVVRFKGGLGNQMFQYALVEALRSRGRNVGCSLGFYRKHPNEKPFILDKVFRAVDLQEVADSVFDEIDGKWKSIKESPEQLEEFRNQKNIKDRFFYVEEMGFLYDENVFDAQNCAYVGYWQTEKYFSECRASIAKTYQFQVENKKILEMGDVLEERFYSIHIRRKDYLEGTAVYGGICTADYYKSAVEYIRAHDSHAKFIIFSDEEELDKLAQEIELKDAFFYSKKEIVPYYDWYDMYLMTRCKGNIIANSSFSWWGAWLNERVDKIVAAPSKWINSCNTPDIWCDGWIRL